MVRRQTLKNTLLTIAVILLMAFAVAAIPQTAHAEDNGDHTWNVESITFTPAEPTVKMSQVKERDNDGIYALNLANRYKKGMNNCFFKPGDKCVVTYNDNSTKEFEFSKIKGVGYAEFKAADGEIINLEALHTDNAEELKKSGEVSVDELAAIIGKNGVTIEYGDYWEEGNEILGNKVLTHTTLDVIEDTTHDHKTALRERNKADALCDATGMSRDCQYCQICGKYFADYDATIELSKADLIIPMTHPWNDGEITKAATCTEAGNKHFVCTKCGEEKDEVIPAGHKWSDWKVTKAATCTVGGSQERTCSACSKIEKKSIAAKGHKWKSAYTVDKKATYAAAGSKSIHCSACNAKKPKSVVSIPKLKVKAVTLTGVKAVKRGFTAKWTKGSGINGYEMQYALNKKFTKSKKTIVIKKPGTISKKVTKLRAKKKYYVRIRAYKIVNKKKYYSAWGKIKTVTTKR